MAWFIKIQIVKEEIGNFAAGSPEVHNTGIVG
jgi:hypothetical protein